MIFRSIVFNFLFYFTIIFFGILFLPFLVSRKLTRLAVRFWSNLIIYFLENLVGANIDFQNNYIFKNEGYLIAANHQSVFDTIFFLRQFDKVVYVVKKELMYLPIYGWYAIRLGNIFIDRKERVKSLKNLSESVNLALHKKYKVIIFPEGTRQIENKIGTMKPGIFLMQQFCKTSVYPAYINSLQVWPKKSFVKKAREIRVKILKPIKHSRDKKKFLKTLEDKIKNEHNKN